MILGTAGHVDHGKTSLVKALTGIDTDRLKEEKRRGITLELGFAHLALPGGATVGVVDVPGHERFVKAMAAGAGGIDLALLVIALDEGVMPQTREHLDICGLLGVRAGLVVLTKSDLLPTVGEEWQALLEQDVAALTRGTFLEGARVVPVSSRTGEGLERLKAEIASAVAALAERPSEGPAFLPVDRAFSLKGFGTVVTGTLLAGQLGVEDAVSLLPGVPGPLRARSLQVHGQPAARAVAGQRTAVNLPGIEAQQIERGMVLCHHGALFPTRMLDVELRLLPGLDRPLKRRQKLLLHLGTAQVEATVALLDLEKLEPGQSAFAQLRLGEPVAALPDQRFILRGFRPLQGRGTTVAGGRVLSISAGRRRKGAAGLLAPLAQATPEVRICWQLQQAGFRGATFRELFGQTRLSEKALHKRLEELGAKGAVLLFDKERRAYLAQPTFALLLEKAKRILEDFHAREPMREGLSKEELRGKLAAELDAKLFARVLQALEQGQTAEPVGELVRLKGRGRVLTAGEAEARGRLVEELSRSGLGPPTLKELAERHRLTGPRALELLKVAAQQGEVLKVTDELFFHREALEALKERLVAHLREQKEISTQAFKEMVGQSRKYVIPLSEYFDRERVTLRVGDKRVLRRA